jgi:hypothetical protein
MLKVQLQLIPADGRLQRIGRTPKTDQSSMTNRYWSLLLLSMLTGQAHLARAEPNASATEQPKAPDLLQQCHIKEFVKPIFPDDPYIMFAPASAKVEASMGASSRCSFGVQITLPCMKKLGTRLDSLFKVNGDEEEGKKLIASFAASEEELNKSMDGVSFSYTVQEQDAGAKFSNIAAVTIDEKGRKQKEKFSDVKAFQKAFNMADSMNVDDSVKKLCALNDVPDDKFMEKLGEVVGQTSSKK